MTAMKAQRRQTRRSEVFVLPKGLAAHFEQKNTDAAMATTTVVIVVGGGKVRIPTAHQGEHSFTDELLSQTGDKLTGKDLRRRGQHLLSASEGGALFSSMPPNPALFFFSPAGRRCPFFHS
jgi:hypothetical protein